jgi:hypothetical protein
MHVADRQVVERLTLESEGQENAGSGDSSRN